MKNMYLSSLSQIIGLTKREELRSLLKLLKFDCELYNSISKPGRIAMNCQLCTKKYNQKTIMTINYTNELNPLCIQIK